MSEQTSGDLNQQTEAAIPSAREEITDNTLRKYPFIVPRTQGDYVNIRYLAGCRKCKLADVGVLAIRRGQVELARDTLADHMRGGRAVPQRLALLARGDFTTVHSGQSEESQGEHTRC
jgi:hypothetical protein